MPATGMAPARSERRTMAKVGSGGLNVLMTMPADPRGVIIVADGSGDSSFADGDLQVARTLLDEGFAVVEVRLLDRRELAVDAETSGLRFNTGLLADRLADIVAWIGRQPACRDLKVGLFATGTCGAAALRAAVRDPDGIDAVACRAARVEIIAGVLGRLCAETLLLLGATDIAHLEANRHAQQLAPPGVIELGLIEGGRPMLDGPAEREVVSRLTTAWFKRAFGSGSPRAVKGILADSTPRHSRANDTLPWRTP